MKKIVAIVTVLLMLLGTVACSQVSGNASTSVSGNSTSASSTTTVTKTDSEFFTARDFDVGYEESTATKITLTDGSSQTSGSGVEISGDIVTITTVGTYLISGKLSNGQLRVNAPKTDKVQLVFDGVEIANDTTAPVYIVQADKVFITLKAGSSNYLTDTGNEYIQTDENTVDAVLFSKEDLTINGAGDLTIKAGYKHGVVSNDDLKITGGNFNVTSAQDAFSGKDCLRIAGGTMSINADDDGLHSDAELLIQDGVIVIESSYEGIEGATVTIEGGKITLNSSDDGINAAGGESTEDNTMGTKPVIGAAGNSSYFIKITGGELDIVAGGDGIDSNGDLTVTGGLVYVSGPENGANSSLDYDGKGTITGGIAVTAGASGMAQNFGSASTQCSLLYNLTNTQNAGTTISLTDTTGKALVSYTPKAQYRAVVISTPELVKGETYTLTAGTETGQITFTDTLFSNGGMGGKGEMGGMNGEKPQRGERPNMQQPPEGIAPPERPQDDSMRPNKGTPDTGSSATAKSA